jgi:hypothetical protein
MRTFEAKSNGATERRGYATNSTLAGINLVRRKSRRRTKRA